MEAIFQLKQINKKIAKQLRLTVMFQRLGTHFTH
jgi:hypothetical protein